jgi:hypothetical protein
MPSSLFARIAVIRSGFLLMSALTRLACVVLVGLLLIEPRLKRL